MVFDYTRTAIDLIIQIFKKVIFWIAFCTQIFTIAYLGFSLITQTGNTLVNTLLLLVSVSSFVYFIYTYKKEGKEKNEDTIKHLFSFSKLAIKLFNLGIIIYGFYTATTVSPVTIIITVLAIICWILQILFEIIAVLIDCLKFFLLEAIQADINCVKKPFVSTGNFFKRLLGKEVQEKQPTNTQKILDKHIQAKKNQKKQKKIEKQQQKLAQKQAQRQAKKAAKRDAAPVVSGEIATSEDEE